MAEFTEAEMKAKLADARQRYANTIPVIQGATVNMPSDVIYDGLVAKGHQWPIVINAVRSWENAIPQLDFVENQQTSTCGSSGSRGPQGFPHVSSS